MDTFREISAAVGLFLLFGSAAALYMELKMKLKALKEQMDEVNEQKKECMKVFTSIHNKLNEIEKTGDLTKQQLEDFIKWQKNGKGRSDRHE